MNRLLLAVLVTIAALPVVLFSGEAAAQHRPTKGTISLGGQLSAVQLYLDDVNDVLREIEDGQRLRGASAEHGVYDSGVELGGVLSYQLATHWSVGLEFGAGSSDIVNTDFVRVRDPEEEGRIIQDDRTVNGSEVKFKNVSASLLYWLPLDEGLFVGAEGGILWGDASSNVGFADFLDASVDFEQSAEWSGSGPALGAFAGYNFRFSDHVYVAFKGGYRYRKITSMTGCIQHSILQPGECVTVDGANVDGTLEDLGFNQTFFDDNNESVDFDFSGAYFNVSLGFFFGGSEE